MNQVVVLRVDDWAVLFVNGKRIYENHSIQLSEIAQYCPIESIFERYLEELEDRVMELGRFPDYEECMQTEIFYQKNWKEAPRRMTLAQAIEEYRNADG